MYGCIIGKDEEGVWLLAEGYYESLSSDVDTLKRLESKMDIRLVGVDEETMASIRDNGVEIKNKFGGLFE